MVSLDEAVENAWMRSHARCECRRGCHHQGHRCPQELVWEDRAQTSRRGAWAAHNKRPPVFAGWEAVKQVEILCWACYQEVARTRTPAPRTLRDRTAASIGYGEAGRAGTAPLRGTQAGASAMTILDSHQGSA